MALYIHVLLSEWSKRRLLDSTVTGVLHCPNDCRDCCLIVPLQLQVCLIVRMIVETDVSTVTDVPHCPNDCRHCC